MILGHRFELSPQPNNNIEPNANLLAEYHAVQFRTAQNAPESRGTNERPTETKPQPLTADGVKTPKDALQLSRDVQKELQNALTKSTDKEATISEFIPRFQQCVDLADKLGIPLTAKIKADLAALDAKQHEALAKRGEADDFVRNALGLLPPATREKAQELVSHYDESTDPQKRASLMRRLEKDYPNIAESIRSKEYVYDQTSPVMDKVGNFEQQKKEIVEAREDTRISLSSALRMAGHSDEALKPEGEMEGLMIYGELAGDANSLRKLRAAEVPGLPEQDRDSMGAAEARREAKSSLPIPGRVERQPEVTHRRKAVDINALAKEAVDQFDQDLSHGVPHEQAVKNLSDRYDAALNDSLQRAKPFVYKAMNDLADVAQPAAAAAQMKSELGGLDAKVLAQIPEDQQEDAQDLVTRYNSDGATQAGKDLAMKTMERRYPMLAEAVKAKEQKFAEADAILESSKQVHEQYENIVDAQINYPKAFSEALKKGGHESEAQDYADQATNMYLRMIQNEIRLDEGR